MSIPKRQCIAGHEWYMDPISGPTPTGTEVVFLAKDPEEAVAFCLYTEKLRNGRARISSNGRAVLCGDYMIVFPPKNSF